MCEIPHCGLQVRRIVGGLIEETSAGVARCVGKGFVCRVYTAAGLEEFAGKKGSNDLVCARCRYSGKQGECV